MADTIWEARLRTGLSRERVCARLVPAISTKTLERWEKGVSPCPGWRETQLRRMYDEALGAVA